MRDLLALLVHFLTTLARLLGPGGTRAVIAETLLIKRQLVILPDQLQRWPRVTTAIWHQAAYVSATPAGNQSAGPSFDEAQVPGRNGKSSAENLVVSD